MAELVFITGASSGIGQALALRYYRDGAHFALVARRTDELARWALNSSSRPIALPSTARTSPTWTPWPASGASASPRRACRRW